MLKLKESKIAIIGLGYVGLPLAAEVSEVAKVIENVRSDVNIA